MKIKFSALVSDMRGKLNGSVASRNRGGSYLRNKTTPVNPQTPDQQVYRSAFGAISSTWRSLPEAFRESYRNGADEFPYIDIFGDTRHLSGPQLFQKTTMNKYKVLGSIPSEAFTPPPAFPAFPEDAELYLSAGDGIVEVNLEGLIVPDGMVIIAYATPPLGLGVTFAKNRFRLLDVPEPIGAGGILDLSAEYANRYGVFSVNTHIQIRLAFLDPTSGFQSAPLILDRVVTA